MGWQTFKVPLSTRITSITGGWTVDERNYSFVRAGGHTGADAKQLAPHNIYKFNQSYPFGALLVRIPNSEEFWVHQSQQLPQTVSQVETRINDDEPALADNAGSLKVCFGR